MTTITQHFDWKHNKDHDGWSYPGADTHFVFENENKHLDLF